LKQVSNGQTARSRNANIITYIRKGKKEKKKGKDADRRHAIKKVHSDPNEKNW